MTRPLNTADRLPKQGDVLIGTGGYLLAQGMRCRVRWIGPCQVNKVLVEEFGRAWVTEWQLEEMNSYFPPRSWCEWDLSGGILNYDYVSRADGGRVDWPIDAGAFV